jgi:hypothetical protein
MGSTIHLFSYNEPWPQLTPYDLTHLSVAYVDGYVDAYVDAYV